MVCLTQTGRRTCACTVPTTIPQLVEAIEAIPRPRALALEESSIADWLLRNLSEHVDSLIVCNPRRNALIAKDSDKDDSIDAEKLADLLRGGYLKAVHHPQSLERMIFKQTVGLYRDTVRHRVREANRSMAFLRRWGIFVRESAFSQPARRSELLLALPDSALVRANLSSLFHIYDTALRQEAQARKRLIRLARKEEIIRQWEKLPGVSWIRGALFFVYLDTPWRFKKKTQLFRYMGVGLERRGSGDGPRVVRVSQEANHALKWAIIGAAKSAILQQDNPFYRKYRSWRKQGLSPRNARRNVARSLAMTLWSMWKTGNDYRPEWVGLSQKQIVV